jgi:hypothetical protein
MGFKIWGKCRPWKGADMIGIQKVHRYTGYMTASIIQLKYVTKTIAYVEKAVL